MEIKYIFFDVANTLLYKPDVFLNISKIFQKHGLQIEKSEIISKHKALSEIIEFPDKTSQEFYNKFNTNFLFLLGIIPSQQLIDEIFFSCKNLPWIPFEDTIVLNQISMKMGIISNWDLSLSDKLMSCFNFNFDQIIGSASNGLKKPSVEFYKFAIQKVNIKPENILYIGDSLNLDIKPALEVGMNAVLIDRDNFYKNYNGLKISNLNQLNKFITL
jgi:FMN phosphatase YigB (HAD superfamily)